MTAETKNILKVTLILGAIGLLSIIIAGLTGGGICPIYSLIGVPCVSCGMTRAWTKILSGDLNGAFLYHPLFFSVLFLPLLARRRVPCIAAFILLALFGIVWVIRMVTLFPNVPPMTVNENAPVMSMIRGM